MDTQVSAFQKVLQSAKPRRKLAAAFLFLPIPFLINLALHGGSKMGMPEMNFNGDQTAVLIMYTTMALNFLAFFIQVIYTGQVLSQTIPQSTALGVPQLLLFYLPGNLVITLLLELMSYYSVFVSSEHFLARLFLGGAAFVIALEIWFRYFRKHGLRFQGKTLLRQPVFTKYKLMIFILGALCSLSAILPEKGIALLAVTVLDGIASILVWEALGNELNALNE